MSAGDKRARCHVCACVCVCLLIYRDGQAVRREVCTERACERLAQTIVAFPKSSPCHPYS